MGGASPTRGVRAPRRRRLELLVRGGDIGWGRRARPGPARQVAASVGLRRPADPLAAWTIAKSSLAVPLSGATASISRTSPRSRPSPRSPSATSRGGPRRQLQLRAAEPRARAARRLLGRRACDRHRGRGRWRFRRRRLSTMALALMAILLVFWLRSRWHPASAGRRGTAATSTPGRSSDPARSRNGPGDPRVAAVGRGGVRRRRCGAGREHLVPSRRLDLPALLQREHARGPRRCRHRSRSRAAALHPVRRRPVGPRLAASVQPLRYLPAVARNGSFAFSPDELVAPPSPIAWTPTRSSARPTRFTWCRLRRRRAFEGAPGWDRAISRFPAGATDPGAPGRRAGAEALRRRADRAGGKHPLPDFAAIRLPADGVRIPGVGSLRRLSRLPSARRGLRAPLRLPLSRCRPGLARGRVAADLTLHPRRARPAEVVLDPAAGRCEFINAVPARERWAVDQVAFPERAVDPGTQTLVGSILEVELPDSHFDGVFLLQLPRAPDLTGDGRQRARAAPRHHAPGRPDRGDGPGLPLLPRGVLGLSDHTLALTHVSVAEHLYAAGFEVVKVVPRFLPYSFRGRLPASAGSTSLYLRAPIAWRVLGAQFLVVGERGRD